MRFGSGLVDLGNGLREIRFEVQALAWGGHVGSEEVDEGIPGRLDAAG